MKNVFSIIWKVIAVAMICVGVYLLLQVIGEAENVIDSYEQLTGNSIGATKSIKIIFLRDYVKRTGNTDILVTLNVSPAEVDLILTDDNGFEGATPEDDTQTSGESENSGSGSSSGSGNGGGSSGSSGSGNGSGNGSGGTGTTSGSNPGFMKQTDPVIAQIKGGASTATMSTKGCGIVALYNAYYANTSNPISMKEMLLQYSREKLGGAVKEDSNGNLQGRIGDLGHGAGLWNWMVRNYYSPGRINSNSSGKTVNQSITEDGTYIVYYYHADTGEHWVYCIKSGNSLAVYNPSGKEGQEIGNLKMDRWYKIS